MSLNNRFKLGFAINTSFMLFEFIVGIVSGSLILIADATHNLTDSITLAVSWLGNRFANKPADTSHTFGHGRISVLTAFINSSILVGIAVLIFIEAYQRFIHPVPLEGGIIAGVAAIGIVANSSVAALFRSNRTDLNVRAAYTNMAVDAIFSVASLIAGLLILLTHKTWIDPAISIGIGVGLLYAAFGILRQALNIFLEGVPANINLDEIREVILGKAGIKSVSNIYVWAISSNEYILSCTVIPTDKDYKKLKDVTDSLRRELQKLGFAKVIIEVT